MTPEVARKYPENYFRNRKAVILQAHMAPTGDTVFIGDHVTILGRSENARTHFDVKNTRGTVFKNVRFDNLDLNDWQGFDARNPKDRLVLSLCRQMGWVTDHPTAGRVADMKRLGDWLKSERSPVRKSLLEMDDRLEKPKVIKALENMVKQNFQKV